jgi:hypothetical protein
MLLQGEAAQGDLAFHARLMDLALQAANTQGALLASQCPVFVFRLRRMANGEWRMANGEWRMANYRGGAQCHLVLAE